jgi:hypothetical protein
MKARWKTARYFIPAVKSGDADDKIIKLRQIASIKLHLIPFDELEDKFKRIDMNIVAAHEWIKTGKNPPCLTFALDQAS